MPVQRQARIKIYSNRGQGMLLVLHALWTLGGQQSKQEVITFVQDAELYEITRHDLPPYANQNEPLYHTLLAWARKDALINEWLINTRERDAWALSRAGREILDRTMGRYRSGELNVRRCYLWTPKFKKIVDPTYEPSDQDALRPEEVWLSYVV